MAFGFSDRKDDDLENDGWHGGFFILGSENRAQVVQVEEPVSSPAFLLLVILPSDFHPSQPFISLVVFGIVLAESIRVWAVGYAGSATRTRGDTVSDFVHAGPYRFVRNPLYVANILLYTLCGLLFGSLVVTLIIFAYSCIQYVFIVAFEENVLSQTFGKVYADYVSKVPRWLVSSVPCCESSGHTFNLGRALRSERSTFYSMSIMAVIYLAKQYFCLKT